MISGLSTRVSVENGLGTAAPRPPVRSWRILDADRRLAVIEQALRPANDTIDGFPPAL